MMWDETQLGEALRAEINGPAPAVQTQLADIRSRGLRRRRARQAGTAAMAVVTVVGVGIAAAAVGGGPQSAPADPPPSVTSVVTPEVAWPRVSTPARTPLTTNVTTGTPVPAGACASEILLSGRDKGLSDGFRRRLTAALTDAVAPAKVDVPAVSPAGPDAYVAEVVDSNGPGLVTAYFTKVTGSPLDAADKQIFDQANCLPPRRTIRPDGTVLQIYPTAANGSAQTLAMTLRIYRPNGNLYTLSVYNFGTSGQSPKRDTLPLTETQLAAIGEAVADAG